MSVEAYLGSFVPELILLVGACAVLVAGVTRAAKDPSLISGLTLIVVALSLFATIWAAEPAATTLLPGMHITSLTFYVRVIALGVALLLVLVNWHQPVVEERGEYMSMILFSLLGVLLTASANDLLVLFFAIELVSIPTYVLIALSRSTPRAAESAVKYFFLGALSAAIFAYGLSFLYGVAGTTTMIAQVSGTPDLQSALAGPMGGYAVIGFVLVFAGLAFKVAAVPFHVYAPDVYEGAASPVTGLLGFVPKLAGFVALIKLFAVCSWQLPTELMWMIWVIAAATMTVGNVLALLQTNVKRMLGYSSIAHTGYMLIALLVGPVAGKGPMHDGVAALLFYIAVYGVMNLGVFALLSSLRVGDRDVETLDDLAGLHKRAPGASLALGVCVFSLMGFPLTAGFLGKVYVFASAFSLSESHAFCGPLIALAVIGVVNSAIAAAYYLRIVTVVYMGQEREPILRAGHAPVRWGLALCSVAVVVTFLFPAALTDAAREATATLQQTAAAFDARIASAPNHHGPPSANGDSSLTSQ